MSPERTTQQPPIGVALAGGMSRRMGQDKALIELDGQSLIETTASRLSTICEEVVVADGGRRYLADYSSVPDGPGAGPAAGILGAARERQGRDLLVLACDLPGVTAPLLIHLAKIAADWAVPEVDGRLEPLVALYRPPALERLEQRVQAGNLALHQLATEEGLTVHRLAEDELARFGPPSLLFRNLNRPADL